MSSRKDMAAQARARLLPMKPAHGQPCPPGVAQPKMTGASQMRARPAPPPAYRPQPTPKVLQTKMAHVRPTRAGQAPRKSVAPPVYRPQPAPKVLQKKETQARPPAPVAAASRASARKPPIAPRVVQRKTSVAKTPVPKVAPPRAAPRAAPTPPTVIQPMSLVSKRPTWQKTKKYYKDHYELHGWQQQDFGAGLEPIFVCNACNRTLPRAIATVDHRISQRELKRLIRKGKDAPPGLRWGATATIRLEGTGKVGSMRIPKDDWEREGFLEKYAVLDLDNLQLMCGPCNSRKGGRIANRM